MKVRIDIDTNTFVRFWLVVIGFGLAGMMIYMSKTALLIIGVALFLAVALSKPVAKIASILPGRSRLGGIAIAYTSLVVAIGLFFWLLVPPLVHQTVKFAQTIPSLADQVSDQWYVVGNFIDKYELQPHVDSATESLKNRASSWAAGIGDGIVSSVGSFASFVAALLIVVVMSFLMLLEGPKWLDRLWAIHKDKTKVERRKRLLNKVYNVFTGYINGQLTVSGIGALCSGLAVLILSFIFGEVDASLVFPTILVTFVLTLIPMFGSTLAGVVVGLLLLFNNVSASIIYVIYFILYQQVENNFISPAIQSKKVELSALAVLVAVTIGMYISGIIGGIVAVPIAGSLKIFLEDYLERTNRDSSKKKLAKKATKKAA